MSGSPALGVAFDEASHVLTLFRDGRQIARGVLQTKLGRQMIEQFLAAYMKAGADWAAAHRFGSRPQLHRHRR